MSGLRENVIAAKAARNRAVQENALAENQGRAPVHSAADLESLRLGVDVAALEARSAGVDISDLVGPSVGVLDGS